MTRSCECWYHYGCEGLDNNGLSNDSESYICRSCKQDHENELTHSLAEIDTCTQRNDESELIQTVSSAEVMNIDTECDKSGSKQPDSSIEKKVQVGKDQEKAQSEKDSHSKNQGGKKPN